MSYYARNMSKSLCAVVWRGCKPIIVFSLDQAEQFTNLFEVPGSWRRWYWGMRGITLLDNDLHRGHRNSDFSMSKDVGCRVR